MGNLGEKLLIYIERMRNKLYETDLPIFKKNMSQHNAL